MIPLLLLAAGTLVSEDLTCIGAGLLVRRGQLHWSAAVAGCFMGIYVGDLGLWVMGNLLGRQVLRIDWLARRVSGERLQMLGAWFDRHSAASVFAARFLPGTRLPIYVAAGALGRKGAHFALWSLLAALLWTPILVLLAASLGDTFAGPFKRFVGAGWLSLLLAALISIILLRLVSQLTTEIGRAKLFAAVSRIWRWEFWPTWLFYMPLAPWIAWLSLRWRGFTTITAANPGILHGGFVGESKSQIMTALNGSNHVSLTILIELGGLDQRVAKVERLCWDWPIILKPDVGQRGAGVKLAKSLDDARRYFTENNGAVIAQPYHAGPFEAGIFYYRYPGETQGRILSITDKQFPVVIGDGVASLEELVWRDKRLRMQGRTFLARHQRERERVLASHEIFRLAIAGNHCQGTLFRDGGHLLTPALERAVDRVAQSFQGFYFGRFDVRYTDIERFKAGDDFTVIELNGVTSESTNIYDPHWSLLRAYCTLFRQWTILFRIGAMNRRLGQNGSSALTLARDVVRYYRGARPALAD